MYFEHGMMDIARHGIFTPQYFSFREVMYIYLAVMVTDIVLLDMFNSFGMPTSTTVSMVFELLGASFAFVMIKMAGDGLALGMGDYLNTSKALEVIFGIFMSVPLAFIFGSLIQYLTRLIFTFEIFKNLRFKIGIFGGVAITSILYFMLFKGLKQLSFMSADVKAYLDENILMVLGLTFVVSTILMQLLHMLKSTCSASLCFAVRLPSPPPLPATTWLTSSVCPWPDIHRSSTSPPTAVPLPPTPS